MLIQKLHELGADFNQFYMGLTGLTWAVMKENISVIKKLFEIGANPNVWDRDRSSPLMAAVKTGNLQIVKMLLDKGANPKDRNVRQQSPLTETKDPAILTLLKRLIFFFSFFSLLY